SKVVDRVSVSRQCRLTPSDGMVGQDREEANRLQQAKWEPTSRIRDESNVPNAFHFSRRSRKRYSAETVPQPVTASQGTILCKAARNSVSWRCPIETALPAWPSCIQFEPSIFPKFLLCGLMVQTPEVRVGHDAANGLNSPCSA